MPAPRLIALALCAAVAAAHSPAALAKDWDVRAKGRVLYDDGAGLKPIAGAKVSLRDSDTVFDETIGEGVTDANGNFNVPGRGGDTGLPFGICDDNCTKPDPYVTVALQNDRIEVETELGFTWHANTGVHGNTAGEINFGSFKFSSTDGGHAEILFGRTTVQYDNYSRLVGGRIPRHDGKINLLFPAVLASGVPWTTEESIHWPGGEDRWNAVFHEFGHRIRHAQDGDFAHFLYDVARFTYPQQHWTDKRTNTGFAFNEGWAEYHATLLDPTEHNRFAHWAQIAGGDEVEGNVAQKLMHVSDTCGGFKTTWATLQSASIHSYAEYEAALKKKFPACLAPKFNVLNPGALVKFVPLTLEKQTASLNRITTAVAVKPPVFVKAVARVSPAATFSVQHAALLRLNATKTASHELVVKAATDAFRKHFLSLRPITLELAKSGEFLKQRQVARAGFLKEALTPQLTELDKLLAQVKHERSLPANAILVKHFDYLKVRYEKRAAELKAALAQPASPSMKIPVHLLPRSLGAAVTAVQ